MVHNKLLADATYNLQGGGIQVANNAEGAPIMEKIISNVIGILTVFAIIFFVFQIIIAGYSFISSQGDEKKLEAARSRLTNGILGLTIIVIALGIGSLIAYLLGLNNLFDLPTILNSLNFQ